MKTVMGLFEHRSEAEAAAAAIHKAGVPEHRIKLADNTTPPGQLIEPGPRSITMQRLTGFTIFLTLIFAIFGIAAGIGSIFVFGASTNTAVLTVIIFLLIGAFCGLFMGWIMGRSDADNAIQEYREALSHGHVLVTAETDKHLKAAAAAMRSQGAHWMTTTAQINPLNVYHAMPELVAAGH